MGNGRPLDNYREVRKFLETEVNIKDMIEKKDIFINDSERRNELFSKSSEDIENIIIKKVYDANCDLECIYEQNTYEDNAFRLKYIKTHEREQFRSNVVINLLREKVEQNENLITEFKGGVLPVKTTIGKDKKIFYLIGLPASGKSTIANYISNVFGCVILDSDIVKRKIPEFDSRNGATLVHAESKEIIKDVRNLCILNEYNIIEPIIGDDFNELSELINKMISIGYSVYVIHTNVDVKESLYRSTRRFIETNRYVPINKIIDTYSKNTLRTYNSIVNNFKHIKCININTTNKDYENVLYDYCNNLNK